MSVQVSVLGRLRACLACGSHFKVNPRHAKEHTFCSPKCRAEGYRQAALPFDPAPAPLPPVVDQRVPLEDLVVLRGHNAAVLARLREGPASGAELERVLGAGSAWRTRVSDVRRWLERRGETVVATRVGPRRWEYSIEREQPHE